MVVNIEKIDDKLISAHLPDLDLNNIQKLAKTLKESIIQIIESHSTIGSNLISSIIDTITDKISEFGLNKDTIDDTTKKIYLAIKN